MPIRRSDALGHAAARVAIALGLLVAGAVGAWLATHLSGPGAYRLHESLLARLDAVSTRWEVGALVASEITLLSDASGPLVRLRLEPSNEWVRVFQDGEQGLRGTRLAGWMLPIELPTAYPGAVRIERAGDLSSLWERPRAPDPFSAFYSNSGFLANGLYLALPEGVDPNTQELSVLFPPETDLLRDLVGASNGAVDRAGVVSWVKRGNRHRRALYVPNRAAVEIPASIPERGALVFWVTRRVYPWVHAPEPTSLTVELHTGADWQEIGRADFSSSTGDSGAPWSRVQVDVEKWAGRETTLRFRVPGSAGTGKLAHYVADPMLVAPRFRRSKANLLVITIDGMRADLRPWESRDDGLTPHLAGLASRGVTFTQARSAAPWTRASVASMFTGMSPLRHGVDSERDSARLATGIPTLAQVLRSHGYWTALQSANPHLDPAFGLAEGFSDAMVEIHDGAALTDGVLTTLAERPFQPFFLFAFYMDTHAPWTDRPEYWAADAIDARVRDPQLLGMAHGRRQRGEAKPTPREVAKLRALYEENVRYTDAQIGRLLDGLKRMGLTRRTIVVITADHGEAFGDHGDFFHGWNVYDELSRVPLIAAGPGVPHGRQFDTPVSLTTLPSLLLRWIGLEEELPRGGAGIPETLDGGRSVEPILMSTRFRDNQVDALLRWPWKLIVSSGEMELYNVREDPRERNERTAGEHELARRLHRELQRLIAEEEAERSALISPPDTAAQPDESTLDQLRALGYIGGSR